jgi:HlyD family secretion protein
MNAEKLKALQIDSEQKKRPQGSVWAIFAGVLLLTGLAVFFAWPRLKDQHRVKLTGVKPPTNSAPIQVASREGTVSSSSTNPSPDPAKQDVVLTVSGYIIARERIELSPRFLGVVKWIGVKKGDTVTNEQVVVELDNAEYKARLVEADGRVASAQANVTRAELDFERVSQLAKTDIESKKAQDDARMQLQAARADLKQAEGAHQVAKTFLDWTIIRSPINGVVLEKLVNPNELVVPQSFGGTRGPSTALLAVADLKDLQVEIDVNEADLSKISLQQKCRVSPEAYPDKSYPGVVAEIAPEANRSKGTLQIKVQILNPDKFLTPELSAKVDFLKGGP